MTQSPLPKNEEWLTLTQVANMLNIGKFTLYKLRRAGKLHDHYIWGEPDEKGPGAGGKTHGVRIAKSEVESMMASGKRHD